MTSYILLILANIVKLVYYDAFMITVYVNQHLQSMWLESETVLPSKVNVLLINNGFYKHDIFEASLRSEIEVDESV